MHQSLVVYQLPGMDDQQIIANIMKLYEDQGRTVSAIVEVDDEGLVIAPLYACPGFLEECRQYMIKMFQGRN